MRAWVVAALVLAGCLRGPVLSTPAEADPRYAAHDAWKKHVLSGAYEAAAETAWAAKLDPMLIGFALQEARKDATAKLKAYAEDRYSDDPALGARARHAFSVEARIACRYGPSPASALLAIEDALKAHAEVDDEAFRQLLLVLDCPVDDALRTEIIEAAAFNGQDAFAFEQILKAGWDADMKAAFAADYFAPEYGSGFGFWGTFVASCDRGLRAVSALRPRPDDVIEMLENADCEIGTFDPAAWHLPQEDARRYFFAAMRSEEFDLAYALKDNARMGGEAMTYLFQEMLRGHWTYKLNAFLKRHPEAYERAMAYALAHDELRAVAHLAKTGDWARRAFDRALELKRYEDATVIAETACMEQALETQKSCDEAFQKEGPALAFQAALAAKEYRIAHRLAQRNPELIDKKEAKEAADGYYDWLARQPLPPMRRVRRKKPRLPKCPEGWQVQSEPCAK